MILLRYLSREILQGTMAVSVVLLLILLSARFVKYLSLAARGKLDPDVLFTLIYLRIPGFLELILPMSTFIALVLVFGRLYVDNEARVLYAAGVSRSRLAVLAMAPILMVAAVVAYISLSAAPSSLHQVEMIMVDQGERSELDTMKEGQFQLFRNASGAIYATEMDRESGRMKEVYVFRRNMTGGDDVMASEYGKQQTMDEQRYLVLFNGYRFQGLRDRGVNERVDFEQYGQKIKVASEDDELSELEQDAWPTLALWSSTDPEHRAELQWRFSVILLVPVMGFIAIALGRTDPRQGRYAKIFPAIAIYLSYILLLNLFKDLLGREVLPVWVGMWPVHVFFAALAMLIFNVDRVSAWIVQRVGTQSHA